MDQAYHFTSLPSVRQSAAYRQFMKNIGWLVEIDSQTDTAAFIKKIPHIRLSVIKVQRADPTLLNVAWATNLAKKHHSLSTHIELNLDISQDLPKRLLGELRKHRFRQSKSGFLPTKTLVLPIDKSDEWLKKQMKSKTRYNIGKAQRNDLSVVIYTGEECINYNAFEDTYRVLKENAKRKNMYIYPKKWLYKQCLIFGNNCFVINVCHHDQIIATALFLTNQHTATYQHNGSTMLGRKLHAPSLAIWSAIQEARRRKMTYIDFDGIVDPRSPLKRWAGFTRFKKGFGGQEIRYYTSFTKLGWV